MPSTAITSPNLGLYYGLDPIAVPARAVQDGRNFRVKQGRLTNASIGHGDYSAINFGAPVTYLDTFYIRGASQKQIVCTTRDIFEYDESTDVALLLNRRYATGTVQAGGGNDAYTKVLLDFDGDDGGVVVTDSNVGGASHVWTAAGNAQIDTAIKKYGTGAGLFDGSGDYFSTPDHADFTVGSSDFTVDCWFNCTEPAGADRHV